MRNVYLSLDAFGLHCLYEFMLPFGSWRIIGVKCVWLCAHMCLRKSEQESGASRGASIMLTGVVWM